MKFEKKNRGMGSLEAMYFTILSQNRKKGWVETSKRLSNKYISVFKKCSPRGYFFASITLKVTSEIRDSLACDMVHFLNIHEYV